jgi:hypothetical protein
MSKTTDASTLARIARHPNATTEILLSLANPQGYGSVRKSIAENKDIPAEVVELLANDSNSSVRFYLAVNNNIPLQYKLILARDSEWRIREKLSNRVSEVEVQRILQNDSSHYVQASLATNPNLAEEIFLSMLDKHLNYTDSESITICYYLSTNPNAPKEGLERLVKSSHSETKRIARDRLCSMK